jgi:hypothetical protein
MNAALQNANGPATAPTVPDHGSNIPRKDLRMNKGEDNTAPSPFPPLSRRLFLGFATVASLPVTAAAKVSVRDAPLSVDEFLAKALPSERVRYHSNALAEAMADLHPNETGWRVQTCHEAKSEFVLVVPRFAGRASV